MVFRPSFFSHPMGGRTFGAKTVKGVRKILFLEFRANLYHCRYRECYTTQSLKNDGGDASNTKERIFK